MSPRVLRSSHAASPSLNGPSEQSTGQSKLQNAITYQRAGAYGLHVVNDPMKATVDIVLLHGLMGHAYRTWLHEGKGVFWPKDLLGIDFKDARIMVFGYEVNVWHPWNQVSQGWLSGYATHLLGSLSEYRKAESVR